MALRVDEVKTAKNQEEERDGQEEQGDECLEVDEMTEGEEREEEIDIKEEQGGETSSEELLSANERDDRDTHDHYLTGYISEVEDGDSREGAAGSGRVGAAALPRDPPRTEGHVDSGSTASHLRAAVAATLVTASADATAS